jgi:ubiquinone/menaquinone biosynthesis C-methylase UbiE
MSSITNSDKILSRINSHDNFSKHDLNDWIISIIKPQNNEYILDLGCGPGKQIFKIKELFPDTKFLGYDKTTSSLKLIENYCKENSLKDVETINSDLDDFSNTLQKLDNFNLIYSSFALYYSKNFEKLISSIYNKLHDNGRFFSCGPIKGNNGELISFQQSIPESTLEDVTYKMTDDILPVTKKIFDNTSTEFLDNPITFPTLESLMNYWKSSWLFEEKIEKEFFEKAKKYFETNESFVTTKKIIGILGKK